MNNKAFETIFKQHYTMLCRYAYTLVNDKGVAEDIIQNLFMYLWENKQEFTRIISYEAYLLKAVKNRAINYLKSTTHTKQKDFIELKENAMPANITMESIEHKELEAIIKKALEQLPEKCHSIFYMKRFEDLSYKEIAVKLSITEKTVENQMTIAIRKIADYLHKNWE